MKLELTKTSLTDREKRKWGFQEFMVSLFLSRRSDFIPQFQLLCGVQSRHSKESMDEDCVFLHLDPNIGASALSPPGPLVPTSAAAHFLPPSVAFELASTLLGISPITSAWPSVIRSMSYVEVNAAIVPKRPDMFKETFEMHYEVPRW